MNITQTLKTLRLNALTCIEELGGKTLPDVDSNPLAELAQNIREVLNFKDAALSLAQRLGYRLNWPSDPKGDDELKIFFELKIMFLELIGIQWEHRTLPGYQPDPDDVLATLTLCDEIFHWARGAAK